MNKQLNFNKWQQFPYRLTNNVIGLGEIAQALNLFNKNVLDKLTDQYILIIFKIRTSDNLYRTISSLQRINKDDRDKMLSLFREYWNLKIDNYSQDKLTEIIFQYKIIDTASLITSSLINKPRTAQNSKKALKFGSFKLPQTMDLYQWGDVQLLKNIFFI